jgi:hypothetical protein
VGGGERGTHAIAGVAEQPTAVRLDRVTQHVVVCGQQQSFWQVSIANAANVLICCFSD